MNCLLSHWTRNRNHYSKFLLTLTGNPKKCTMSQHHMTKEKDATDKNHQDEWIVNAIRTKETFALFSYFASPADEHRSQSKWSVVAGSILVLFIMRKCFHLFFTRFLGRKITTEYRTTQHKIEWKCKSF